MQATASVTKIVILKQSLQKLNVVEHSTFVGRSPETVSWKTSYLVSVYEECPGYTKSAILILARVSWKNIVSTVVSLAKGSWKTP